MSMAVMTIVMGGVGSAIFIASRSVATDSPVVRMAEAGPVVDQMAGELACALGCVQRSATVVEFTVPDRNGDATGEVIRYAWSGTAGTPLTRQYNGGTAVNVAGNVTDFALTYDVAVETTTVPGPAVESGEQLLLSHEYSGGTTNEFQIKSNRYIGECFHPVLAGGVTAWSVTRVKFRAQAEWPASGQTTVQIRTADGNHLPTSTVLQQSTLYESDLSWLSMGWQEFSFTGATGFSPTSEACLVLKWVSDSVSARIQYESGGTDLSQGVAVYTTDGSTWTAATASDLIFYVYGKITAPSGTQTVPSAYRWQGTRIRLRLGPDEASSVETSVTLLNTPQVTGP
jgi:hypothetical protein